MFGKLSVALLLAASPALANDPASPPAANPQAPAAEYKIKKVCRTVEVAGSFIPRTHCVNKKIPIKKPEADAQEAVKSVTSDTDQSGTEQ